MLQVLIIIPRISIFLCKRLAAEKEEEEKQKQKKRWTRVLIKKERYLCSQVSIYFQDSEGRSYFQIWSIVELGFHLFLSISFIPRHFSHHIKPHMHILI
jgi:hypothetical protein